MARVKDVVKESDSDSDSKDIKKIKQGSSDDEEIEDVKSDEAEEMAYNRHTNPVDNLKIETKFPLELKLQLLAQIKRINKRKTASYRVALNNFDWSQIAIKGHTVEECKSCLNEIIKSTRSTRTLDEMLTDYEKKNQKYDLKMQENAKKEAETSTTKVREGKAKSDLPYITPFMIYREELTKEGKTVAFKDAQQLYKNMPNEEKIKHIQTLLALDTHLEKQLSTQEKKILNQNGMPARPLNAYSFFIKDLCQDKSIGFKNINQTGSALWKTIDPDAKAVYVDQHQKEVEAWQEKMQLWMQTLPVQQQFEQMAKHKFLSTKKRKRDNETVVSPQQTSPTIESDQKKRKKQTTLDDIMTVKKEEPKSVINVISESPTKQPSTNNIQIASVSSLSTNVDVEASTKKIKKEGFESDSSSIESIPKWKKFKRAIDTFGPYPSLTTAHYFMTQKYSGKPSKVAKAYSKLSKQEKKELGAEMQKIKKAYFMKLKAFISENVKYSGKVRTLHDYNRLEQEQSTTWYTKNGTDLSDDDEESDSS